MIWGIGTLFLTSCPNEINTLKLESSDGFLHLRETSLDTKWEVEHFRLFFVFLIAGLVDLGSESLNFSNAPNTDKQMQIYPKIASRLGQHLLRAKPGNLEDWKLWLICSLSLLFFHRLFGCYQGNSLIHPMFITAFWLSIFGQIVTGRRLVSTPNWVPSGAITQLATHSKLYKILFPDLHPVFLKCGNA